MVFNLIIIIIIIYSYTDLATKATQYFLSVIPGPYSRQVTDSVTTKQLSGRAPYFPAEGPND